MSILRNFNLRLMINQIEPKRRGEEPAPRGWVAVSDGEGGLTMISPVEMFKIYAEQRVLEKEHLKVSFDEMIEKIQVFEMLDKLTGDEDE